MSSEVSEPTPPSAAGEEALPAAVREAQFLYQLSLDLCSAATMQDAIAAMARPWLSAGATQATLSTLELDAQGVPEWINVVARWPPRVLPAEISSRYHLLAIPTSELWRHSPGVQLLVDDVESDERIDANSRRILRFSKVRAAIFIPLTVQDRWVGFVSLTFVAPYHFTDVDRRICQALARLAALVVENQLILDRMHKALHDNRRQSQALETILDNLPVGVAVTELPTGKLLRQNREAARIIGEAFPDQPLSEAAERHFQFVYSGTDSPIPLGELPLMRMVATKTLQRIEMDLLRAGGTRVSVESTAVPLVDDSGVLHSGVLVFVDVTTRKQAEAEQRRMQEELIRIQAAALAERSTPLIPITDDILVLPLIGLIDTERSAQLLEVLLEGVSKNQTRVAIIDVTGVRTIDAAAAGALTRAAQAVRLVGVEPVLTGIRAEVAQTLIGLGLPLSGLVTRSTLQSGIAYAQSRLGKQSPVDRPRKPSG